MRADCRHFDSRTYGSGEVVRKCRLDLAPEAPWRCPDDCPRYERRMIDAGWQYGSLGSSIARARERRADEPEGEDVAALLDSAEDIVNSAAPEILADLEPKKQRRLRRKADAKNKKNKKKR